MKALFNRLNRHRDKEVKPGPSVQPVQKERPRIQSPPPPPFKPAVVGEYDSSNRPLSNASSRPLSQLEISMQKPLPAINNFPPLGDILENFNAEQDNRSLKQEHKENNASLLSGSATSPGSHGRSGRSKQSISHANTDSTNSTSNNSAAAHVKKVAFISPPPTPAALSNVRDLPSDSTVQEERRAALDALVSSTSSPAPPYTPGGAKSSSSTRVPLDSKASSQQAPLSAIPPKLNTAIKGSTPRNGVPGTSTSPSHSARGFAGSPTFDPSMNLRSGTPYSHKSGLSAIRAAQSWSEAAEEDLVINLGPRERTRQEVLWEIVASEQRYVNELLKLKATFIEPLLHPFATSPLASNGFGNDPDDDNYYSHMPGQYRADSPVESSENLPIASRFLSPTPRPPSPVTSAQSHARSIRRNETPVIPPGDGDSFDSDDDDGRPGKGTSKSAPGDKLRKRSRSAINAAFSGKNTPAGRSPYGTSARGPPAPSSGMGTSSRQHVPFPARSHQSLPAPTKPAASTTSLGRQSAMAQVREKELERERRAATPSSRLARKLLKPGSSPQVPGLVEGDAIPPMMLPEDLRKCLEVLDQGVLKGHLTMCDGLKKRYDEQYPLVRSLADVFVKHSSILQGYATYVLHLERALEQVDNALSTAYSAKKPKNQDAADWAKVSRVLWRLEESADQKGETGLAISLSKPFQRLLKYPLLFQNLLYHTDPSTFEYEATLKMVAEVETIVRSIEDEKIQKEERDKTRDVWARIEGLEKTKLLAIPKPSRLLLEEKQLVGSEAMTAAALKSAAASITSASPTPSMTTTNSKAVKSKTFSRRFSDALPSMGTTNSKNDIWLVVFSDVILRCQRTGTTSLPLVTGNTGNRSASLPEISKSKYGTSGRRASQTRPRNMYKFLKVESWDIDNVAKPSVGMVSMPDISRSRSAVTIQPVKSGDTDDEDGNESDESDRKSKMSFSYWGADKVTMSTPTISKAKLPAGTLPATKGPRKSSAPLPPGFTRTESSVQAKFGHRLRSEEGSPPSAHRPASRTRQQVSGSSQATVVSSSRNDDTVKSKERSTSRMSSSRTATVAPTRRAHQASTASSSTAPVARYKVASPTPSHDSGVVWPDPSVNNF